MLDKNWENIDKHRQIISTNIYGQNGTSKAKNLVDNGPKESSKFTIRIWI